MSGAERLEELNAEVLADLADFEARVVALSGQLETLRDQLDAERRRLAGALEELSRRYQPAGAEGQGGSLSLEAIRATERALGEQLLQCAAFARKVSGLANLLTISRGQFAPQAEASTELDTWNLVARTATIKAQEAERYRLAREVHDGPAQVLANAILGLELCEQIARRAPEQLTDELARLKGMVREGLVEVRRFIFDLRPSMLTERGLLMTLQRYIGDFRAYFHLDIELRVPAQLPPLSSDEEITTFRIVQESLQNIQKHARATAVLVELQVDEQQIRLLVRDNGRGFTPWQTASTIHSGAGLSGMRERAVAVGGELRVESQPGEGTTITLVLPRPTAAARETATGPLGAGARTRRRTAER